MMDSNNNLTSGELRLRMVAALVTLIVGILILAIKFWAYNVTGSQAIYSDAMESIVNVITALVGIVIIRFASKPADTDHPYGHGKVEYFSATFEGGLVTFAAIFIIYEAIRTFIRGYHVQEIDFGVAISAVSGVMNLVLGLSLKTVGRKVKSPALEASGVHVISDFWTTAGALVGLVLVRETGLIWIDTLCAILVGLHLGYSGFNMVRRSVGGLMDEEDLSLLSELQKIFERYAHGGIIQIHHVRVIRSGWFHHIDAHAVIPEFWSVKEAHTQVDNFEKSVIANYRFSGEVNFHLDPCRRNYCSVCDYEPCPVRQAPFKKRMAVALDHLRSTEEPEEFRN